MDDDRPRLLVVEDADPVRENLEDRLSSPPSEWTRGSPIVAFQVDVAETADKARRLWDEAFQQNRAYDAVVLDLRLPRNQDDHARERMDDRCGRDLLKYFRGMSQVAVVIHTGYPSLDNMEHSVKHGATDVVIKLASEPAPEHAVFSALIGALHKAGEAFNQQLELTRQVWLENQARKWDREALGVIVSKNMGQILSSAELVAESIARRYGLDPHEDREDPICKGLAAIQHAANGVSDQMRDAVPDDGQAFQLEPVDVAEMVQREIGRVRPSYFLRNVRFRAEISGPLETETFRRDLELMIDELLLSALDRFSRENGPPAEEEIVEVRCAAGRDGKDIVVSLACRAGSAKKAAGTGSEEPAKKAAESESRGLPLVRRIAGNVGARVMQHVRGEQAVVDLLIPVISQ